MSLPDETTYMMSGAIYRISTGLVIFYLLYNPHNEIDKSLLVLPFYWEEIKATISKSQCQFGGWGILLAHGG